MNSVENVCYIAVNVSDIAVNVSDIAVDVVDENVVMDKVGFGIRSEAKTTTAILGVKPEIEKTFI